MSKKSGPFVRSMKCRISQGSGSTVGERRTALPVRESCSPQAVNWHMEAIAELRQRLYRMRSRGESASGHSIGGNAAAAMLPIVGYAPDPYDLLDCASSRKPSWQVCLPSWKIGMQEGDRARLRVPAPCGSSAVLRFSLLGKSLWSAG